VSRSRPLRRIVFAAGVSVLLATGAPRALDAQGVATAAISGIVTDDSGRTVETANIIVVNRATGFRWTSLSRHDGRYTVDGLEVGGPYSVTISRIGFRPQVRNDLTLTLGQTLRVDVVLQAASITLAAVTVLVEVDPTFSPSRTGVGSIVSDSSLRRLPTVNRDVYAFVQLTPQIATWYGPSPSAAGANTAFNSLLLDGANERAFLGGNASGAIWGGKPISLDAVKEYQVQLSPYDVRQGNFSGAQINAVTKSGTNDLQGSGFLYWRNDQLARDEPFLRASPYDRAQFGFTLGGPIVHDRVHFFVAGEHQTLSAPAPPASSRPDTSDITRFVQLLAAHGLTAGSAGPISNTDPTWNAFARLDAALPRWRSRAVLELNYARADTNAFSRPERASPTCRTDTCFPLSSLGRDQRVTKLTTVLRLSTNLASGAYNEATISRTSTPLEITPNVREPLIIVSVPSATGPGPTRLAAGSIEFAQGNRVPQESYEVSDNFTWPMRAHHITVGATVAAYHMEPAQVMNAYGVWTFANLDSLQRGSALDYQVTRDLGGGDVSLRGSEYAFYAGDLWQAGERLSLTFGFRADVPILHGHPPYSATVDTAFGRRTDLVPSGEGLLSPRLGFNWRSSAARRQQVRGGAGLFAGRPPMGWLVRAFQNYGEGLMSVHCVGNNAPPPFPALPNYQNPPTACASPGGVTPGPVNLVADNLKFPQVLRLSLGYDRDLGWGVVATVEGLYTKSIHDFVFVNQNLAGPLGTDRHGRVLYGRIDSLGHAVPSLRDGRFPEVFALENQSRNYSYDLALRLQKDFSNGVAASVAYGYSRVRDVQSHRFLAFKDDWQFGRTLSGDQESRHLGISDFDQPHRLVIVGTYTFPWPTWSTDISLYYLGSSGVPYTYVATVDPRFGDLNADGSNVNDAIYVPASAFDTTEIRFAGTPVSVDSQRQAFEQFVSGTACLRHQRGRILERNSCRTPWVHSLNVSVRQAIPVLRGHTLTAELEIFNFLNLLNRNWGLLRLPNKPFLPQVGLLQQVGETPGAASQAQPLFRFDARPRYDSNLAASYYQIQLAARYTF
jgi:carboxypeptidase family protein